MESLSNYSFFLCYPQTRVMILTAALCHLLNVSGYCSFAEWMLLFFSRIDEALKTGVQNGIIMQGCLRKFVAAGGQDRQFQNFSARWLQATSTALSNINGGIILLRVTESKRMLWRWKHPHLCIGATENRSRVKTCPTAINTHHAWVSNIPTHHFCFKQTKTRMQPLNLITALEDSDLLTLSCY